MNEFSRTLTCGNGLPLRGNDIDTDRIIPARYLKSISFAGLGDGVFIDERKDFTVNGKTHPFDDDRFSGANILVVGKNFGCGSSREHAPQALHRFGIDAIIGESFAEIFLGNCTVIGIPAVCVSNEEVTLLHKEIESEPKVEVMVNLQNSQVTVGALKFNFKIAQGSRQALMDGTWDSTNLLLSNINKIANTFQNLPYKSF